MRRFISRVWGGFWSTTKTFARGLYNNARGLAILGLSTIGGASVLTGIGIRSSAALMAAAGSVYALAA